MKHLITLLIQVTMIGILSLNICAQDRAVFRNSQTSVEVIIKAQADNTKPVVAALYKVKDGKRKQESKFSGSLTSVGEFSTFRLPLPNGPEKDTSYIVSVFEFPTADGLFNYELPVGKELMAVLSSNTSACPKALEITLTGPDYKLADWQNVAVYLATAEGQTTVSITGSGAPMPFPVKDIRVLTNPQFAGQEGQMLVCLELQPDLPQETYSVKIDFAGPPTVDLASTISGKDFKPAPGPDATGMTTDPLAPDKRPMERNLDLGVSFTSSVGERTAPDGTTFSGRTNRGTLDIRFAPLLKIKKNRNEPFDRNQKWYGFFTPVFLDAAVSTGKIEKDTLSMNRVIFGSEYEWRYFDFKKEEGSDDTITDPYVTFHRVTLSGKHASDRDFKQKEFLASIEYSPVIGALNHPLDSEDKKKKFGYEIVPRFGFSLGRTYSRRNPAAAIQPSPNVARGLIGLELTFSITKYLQIGVKDNLYIRGEASNDRIHNYFKGTIEAPLGRAFDNAVNSLFLSFERGNQPPFATRDVNVFKIGYRIRSEGWWDRFR